MDAIYLDCALMTDRETAHNVLADALYFSASERPFPRGKGRRLSISPDAFRVRREGSFEREPSGFPFKRSVQI